MGRSTVSRWVNGFRGGCVGIDDYSRSGRPKVWNLCRCSSEPREIPSVSVFRMLKNDLNKRRHSARYFFC